MSKVILSTRPFREEFKAQMTAIDSDYQFKLAEDAFDWQDVVITLGWQKAWQEPLFAENSQLKWVQSISAGVDYLPLQEYAQRGILVSNASGVHARPIADHLLAVILMRLRGFTETIVAQQDRVWRPKDFQYGYLAEQKILIVGTGQIGQKLAEMLTKLGAKATGINTSGHPVAFFDQTYPLSALKEQSAAADFVINILPLTKATRHLYDADFFAAMNAAGTFINVGRGPSVDTQALIAALEQKQLAYAALDVFEEEPLPSDSPLWRLDNVLLTPHIAGMTPHFQKAFMAIFLANLVSFTKEGQLVQNEVSLDRGY